MPITNGVAGNITVAQEANYHIPQFGGEIWYVATDGNDSNDGRTPDTAKLTIGAAITAAAAGDAISVMYGTYTENGLDLSKDGMELWGEVGVDLTPAGASTCLVVSGSHCRVDGFHFAKAGQVGIQVTGSDCVLSNLHSVDSSIAFDIDADRVILDNCADFGASTTGFDISGAGVRLFNCFSEASGGASRGFYVSAATGDGCWIENCVSTGNGTAGFEVVAGASYNVFKDCASSGDDGPRVDLGTKTMWANFTDQLPPQYHEDVTPWCDGEGGATNVITVSNVAEDETGSSSTQYFWGGTVAIVAPATITKIWYAVGLHLFGTTTAKTQQAALYRTNSKAVGTRNAGNAWDEGATVLTVTDATEAAKFQANDLVWVTSTGHTDGEIVKVVSVLSAEITIARETENSGRTGLRFNHTADGTGEKFYLCYRSSAKGMQRNDFNWSCETARSFSSERFHNAREMGANDGLIVRSINLSDDADALFDLTLIYED